MTRNPADLFTVDQCDTLSIEEVWDLYRKHVNPGLVDVMSSFGFGRDRIDKAEDVWIYTQSGRKILDFTSGIGVLNHGHNHPRVLQARINFQRSKRMEVHKNFFSPYLAALSHNIARLLPGDLNFSFFPSSGSEAVEGAIKLAFKYHDGKRHTVLHSDISFHGKLLGAGSLTASPEVDFQFPKIQRTDRFEYDSISSLQEAIHRNRNTRGESDVYAILVEPYSASSLRACSPEFLRCLRKLCDQEDILLILDEVYTGWAKTGKLFYFMYHDLIPDVLVMAKSLSGGKSSIAGYVARSPVYLRAYGNINDANLHSTTYNGLGEETITAIEAVNILVEDDYVTKAQGIFDVLNPGLKKLQEKFPAAIESVRGVGALNGVVLRGAFESLQPILRLLPSRLFRDERFIRKVTTGAVVNHLYNAHGILTFFGQNREIPLQIAPPLTIKRRELDYFLSSLDATLDKGLTKLVIDFAKGRFFTKLTSRP